MTAVSLSWNARDRSGMIRSRFSGRSASRTIGSLPRVSAAVVIQALMAAILCCPFTSPSYRSPRLVSNQPPAHYE